jgi:5-methyltetrahydrofolate--homocysteine methyltransferase
LLFADQITSFHAVYGYFACRRQGRNRLLLDTAAGDVLLEFPRRKKTSLADYFRKKGDVATFFIVSCGPEISLLEKKLFAADQYQLYMLLHGFGVQLAETLAAKMHQHIRLELGLAHRQGKRFSPGYPTWPDLAEQQKLARLLAADTIGVTVSEAFQLIPELSVSAMVVCHPQAEYF